MQTAEKEEGAINTLPRVDPPVVALLLLTVLLAGGAVILPYGTTSAALLRTANDPVRLSELRLPGAATEQRIASEIDDALGRGDDDLARSFLDLADAQKMEVDAERRRRIGATTPTVEQRSGKDLHGGSTSAASETWTGAVGSFAADMVGVGDLHDLWQEGNKLYRGEPYDSFVLGLATAGVALTGVTIASILPSGGTSVAARAPVAKGLGLLKAARKAGLLSREVVERLVGMSAGAVNAASLKEAVAAARVLNLSAARQAAREAIQPGALRTLASIGEDAVALDALIGRRGVAQAVYVARDARELSRARHLANGMGRKARAALSVLGSAALVLGDVLTVLLQAVWLAVFWAFTTALFARRLGLVIGRMVWGPTKGRLRPAATASLLLAVQVARGRSTADRCRPSLTAVE